MFLGLLVILLVVVLFTFLVSLGVFLIGFKNFLGNREMSSPFECGFEMKKSSRSPFSLRFFLILILFLMFDMEMILVLQFPFFLGGVKIISMFSLVMFMVMLFLATLEEWRRGFLNWVCE